LGNLSMLESFSYATASRFLRNFGGQVVMSVAVSASVAGVFAAPDFLFGKRDAAAETKVDRSQATAWVSPVAANGKIRERHRDASENEAGTAALAAFRATPASLAMPMSVNWPQPVFAQPAQVADLVLQSEPHAPVVTAAPVRKAVVAVERPKLAASSVPMQITPPAVTANVVSVAEFDAPRPPAELLGRAIPEPLARATEMVSSAAGLVGAAGSWTVSQATGLLPRW
jgi:hypothetical protein